jgi:hypothetical protein
MGKEQAIESLLSCIRESHQLGIHQITNSNGTMPYKKDSQVEQKKIYPCVF